MPEGWRDLPCLSEGLAKEFSYGRLKRLREAKDLQEPLPVDVSGRERVVVAKKETRREIRMVECIAVICGKVAMVEGREGLEERNRARRTRWW